MAAGFEPARRLPAYTLSRRAPSSARAGHRAECTESLSTSAARPLRVIAVAAGLGSGISTRHRRLILGLVVLCGAAARTLPLLVANGPQATSIFDEGIYLSAAGVFSEGWMPYRDFAFLHPPSILLLLQPLTALAHGPFGWDDALVVGRWVGVALGTANIVLIALLAQRWRGWVAGVVAATLYATNGPAIGIDRHILLEPAVAAAVLCSALLWLPSSDGVSTRRAVGAGALVGLAATIKLTGGLAIVGILLADRIRSRWRQRAAAVGAAVAVIALIVVPFVLVAGVGEVWRLVIETQMERPGGDVIGGSLMSLRERLRHLTLFGVLNVAAVPGVLRLVAVVAVVVALGWAWVRGGRHGRFWAAVSVVTCLAVLIAPDYYDQYGASVAPQIAIVLAAGVVASLEYLRRYRDVIVRAAAVALVAVLAAGIGVVLRSQIVTLRSGAPDMGALFRAQLGPGDCVSSDAPYLVIAADRLPQPDATGGPLVDPFGEMLAIALEHSSTWPSTSAALLGEPAQHRLRIALAACSHVVLTARPEDHVRFTADTARWFTERYALVLDGRDRPTLWVRRA